MGVFAKTPLAHLGPYELLHKLATGGMSEVYEARRRGSRGFSKPIALKRILPQFSADEELVAMFVDEARLSSQLSHPNLVQVVDFGEEGGELYMAMELVRGTTGAQLVRKVARRRETVPVRLALYIALSIARGLEYAHEACDEEGQPLHLVHRDVSPGNVLLSRSGAIKLSDFGIARAAFLESRTEHGQLKGKVGYMSPEQVLGRELDAQSDQFSTAIVLAEMLIGRPLFGRGRDLDILVRIRDGDLSALARHGSHLCEEVRALLLRALARRPEDRYPTTRAFVEATEDVMRRAGFIVRPAELAAYLERVGLIDRSRAPCKRTSSPKVGPRLAKAEPRDPPTVRRYPPLPPSFLQVAEPLADDAWYRVLLDGVETGPLGSAELTRLFALGRISSTTPIAEGHRGYREAREFEDFDRLVSLSDALLKEPAHEGRVDRFRLDRRLWPGQLVDWMLARKTGLLSLQHGERRTRIHLVEGSLDATASSDPGKLLGALLLAQGAVSPEQVDRGVRLSQKHGSRLGETLVAMGALRPTALFRALVTQTRRRFIDLLSWPSGRVAFYEGARSCEEDTRLPGCAPPVALVADGIREAYPPSEIAEHLADRFDHRLAFSRSPRVGLVSLSLSRPEVMVFERLAAEEGLRVSDLAEICEREGIATKEEGLRVIFMGLSMKILRSERG